MGALLTGFKKEIQPRADKLSRLLNAPIVIIQDWTIIPVNIKKDGRTVRVIEGGIRVECYHEKITNNNCNDCGEFIDE